MRSPCPAKVMLHQLLHAYCTSSEHGTSAPCVLCFSSLDGRHPVKRWSGNDIWLNGLRLTLPGCTLTIMGNVRGLQSQLSADAVLGFFRVYSKEKVFSGQLFFPHNKMETIIFKNRTQEDIKCLPFCHRTVTVYIW